MALPIIHSTAGDQYLQYSDPSALEIQRDPGDAGTAQGAMQMCQCPQIHTPTGPPPAAYSAGLQKLAVILSSPPHASTHTRLARCCSGWARHRERVQTRMECLWPHLKAPLPANATTATLTTIGAHPGAERPVPGQRIQGLHAEPG